MKTDRREVQKIMECARSAYRVGDYAWARQLCAQVLEGSPGGDAGAEAARMSGSVRSDPGAFAVGFVSMALYAIAWFYALHASP